MAVFSRKSPERLQSDNPSAGNPSIASPAPSGVRVSKSEVFCLPAKACPKAILTRSATAFPIRSSISIAADPEARVAVETGHHQSSGLGGRSSWAELDTHDRLKETARAAIRDIGYEQEGFHWKTRLSTATCIRSPDSPGRRRRRQQG